jgi:ATP-binding cassette subfamily F protein 3
MRIDPHDRIALLGANGNGKSTFAKLLAGRLQPIAGHQHRSGKLRAGFFAQHQIEDMTPDDSAFAHLARVMPKARDMELRNRLGRFGFSGDAAFVKVKDLSGGERARLNLALITHDAPNVLILDEPTNHLDIDSRRALADAINDYAGAVILISHDWHLLELTADRLWLVAGGRVRPFDGDLEDYRRQTLQQAQSGRPVSAKQGAQPESRGNPRRKGADPLRRMAKDAERDLAVLMREQKEVDEALAQPALGWEQRQQLMRRRAELAARIEKAEAAWLEAEEALDAAE